MDISNYINIGFKINELESLSEVLSDKVFEEVVQIVKIFGGEIKLVDYTYEFNYTRKFLLENNLKDENPFFEMFDIDLYNKHIQIQINKDNEYIEFLSLLFSESISRILSVECIVLFKNLDVPIALFDNGKLVKCFPDYNKSYFDNKIWETKINFKLH